MLILFSLLITLGFIIVSAAREIVAMGVLNSCVMLLMKSDFISDIFFWLIMKYILSAKVARINKENIKEPPNIPTIDPNT